MGAESQPQWLQSGPSRVGRADRAPRTGRVNKQLGTSRREKPVPNIPPLTAQLAAPLLSCCNPARRARHEKVGGGGPDPRSRSEPTAEPPSPAPEPGLPAWSPPLESPARPGPGLARPQSPGSDLSPRSSAAPRSPPPPGQPLPAATGSGSSRTARPASSSSGGAAYCGSGGALTAPCPPQRHRRRRRTMPGPAAS